MNKGYLFEYNGVWLGAETLVVASTEQEAWEHFNEHHPNTKVSRITEYKLKRGTIIEIDDGDY